MNRRHFSKALAASSLIAWLPHEALHAQATATMAAPQSFELAVPQSQLDDLRYRLQHTRWPDQPADAGWTMGSIEPS